MTNALLQNCAIDVGFPHRTSSERPGVGPRPPDVRLCYSARMQVSIQFQEIAPGGYLFEHPVAGNPKSWVNK